MTFYANVDIMHVANFHCMKIAAIKTYNKIVAINSNHNNHINKTFLLNNNCHNYLLKE